MKLQLRPTIYDTYVQQLGDLEAYKVNTAMFPDWYTTLEEAHQAALKRARFEFASYKRDCEGKRLAQQAIATLESSEQSTTEASV
mgnify:CR=1 FL=1